MAISGPRAVLPVDCGMANAWLDKSAISANLSHELRMRPAIFRLKYDL
jgi:hypothetical protein